MSAQEIIEAALKLSPEERERVGEVLLESVGAGWDSTDLTQTELETRLQEMKTDSSKRVPLEQAFPELRAKRFNG